MAAQVRSAILGRRGADDPLLDLKIVCDAARVSVKEQTLSAARQGQEALLTPLADDRFAVAVDSTPCGGWRTWQDARAREAARRHRFRFRVGHELGHTFFYWRDGGRPRRHLLDSVRQERFCDTFSRALLVPPPAAARLPVSNESVLYLQQSYDVSLELAARSLAAAHPAATVGLWFTPTDDDTRLHLQWSTDNFEGELHQRQAPALNSVGWLPQRRQFLLCLP